MKHSLLMLLLIAAISSVAQAVDYTWDGTTDLTWEGANWDNGVAGQIAIESDGLSPSAPSYDYVGDNFIINNSNAVTASERITFDGGGLSVIGSGLTVTSTGNFSAMNLGHANTTGVATQVLFQNSTVSVSGSGGAGRAIRLQNSAVLTLDGGVTTIENSGNNPFLEVEAGTKVIMQNDAVLNLPVLRIDGQASSEFQFFSGSITLDGFTNSLRGDGFQGAFNWLGNPGEGTLTQVINTTTNQALAFKTGQGFFSIDGVRVNPVLDYDGTNLAAFNAELLSLAVNGKYLNIVANPDGSQTLSLLVPEPMTLSLLGLGGLAILRRRQ